MRFILALFIQCFLTTLTRCFAVPDIVDDTLELATSYEPDSEQVFGDPSQEFVADTSDNPCPLDETQSANRKRQNTWCKTREDPQGGLDNGDPTSNDIATDNPTPIRNSQGPSPAKLGVDNIQFCSDTLHRGPRTAICDSGKKKERILALGSSTLLNCDLCTFIGSIQLRVKLRLMSTDNILVGCFRPKKRWCCEKYTNSYFVEETKQYIHRADSCVPFELADVMNW